MPRKPKLESSEESVVGAGGNWPRQNESNNPAVVKQVNDFSCVAAAGEMLTRHYGIGISQDEIRKGIGDLANSRRLILFLNERMPNEPPWRGGIIGAVEDEVRALFETKKPFLAILREGKPLGHAVVVNEMTSDEIVQIDDPFDQTSYNMRFVDFIKVFSEVVLR